MAEKTNAEVSIGGRVFTLSGYESEEYLQRVASYLNNKIVELRQSDNYCKQPADVQALLMELNIADDYFKAKKQAEQLEEDFSNNDKEIYDLKHELIAAQVNAEKYDKQVADLQAELETARKKISKLEDALTQAITQNNNTNKR